MNKYTLAFACSQDGYIAKGPNDNPFNWTSQEDKNHLNNLISMHDWQVMGRTTHELHPNFDRKRVVFTRKVNVITLIDENRNNQYYFNPDYCQWSDFEKKFSSNILVLGGTKVHDYFFYAELLSKIYITVEPLKFNSGIPAFSYLNFHDLAPFFEAKGFKFQKSSLNNTGTELLTFHK